MEAVGNPKIWVPYMSSKKDCTRRFCSPVTAFPPPPTVGSSENATKFPPFLITIFGILFTGLLLITYFAVVSKFCRKKNTERRSNVDEEMQNQLPTEGGLDESFIKSMGTYEYNKDDGLVKRVDCAVCLSEFQEKERLRILPKCTHCFHHKCIDVWLKSHSTCPLCRISLTCTSSVCVAAPLTT